MTFATTRADFLLTQSAHNKQHWNSTTTSTQTQRLFLADTMTMVDLDHSLFNADHSEIPIIEDHHGGEDIEQDPSRHFGYPLALDHKKISPAAATRAAVEQDGISIDSKKKKKIDPDLMDFQETGKWGSVSLHETICVGIVLLFVVVGVAVAIFVLLDKEDKVSTTKVGPPPAVAIQETIYYSEEQQYQGLLKAIQEHPATIVTVPIMSKLAADLKSLQPVDIYSQAAAWLSNDDKAAVHSLSTTLPRFVLATTYFANGGEAWNESEKWMGNYGYCDWYGIKCNADKELLEVDLSANGLTGTIHEAWALLSNCSSILLNQNNLTGPISGTAFGNMKALTYLQLKDNQLTGTVPLSLNDAGTLGT